MTSWPRLIAATAIVCAGIAGAFAQSNPGTVSNHSVLVSPGPGVVGYRGAAPGAAGQCLTSNGASSDPTFQVCAGGSDITGVTISSTSSTIAVGGSPCLSGDCAFTLDLAGNSVSTTSIQSGAVTNAKLAPAANNTIKSNVSGGVASPSDNTLSAVLDATVTSTQGAIIYRGASTWDALGPSTSGYLLTTGGAAANPSWAAPSSADITSVTITSTNSTLTIGGSPCVSGACSFTADITAPVTVPYGGTGQISLTNHGVLIGQGTNIVQGVGPHGTSGVPLIAQGLGGDPAFGTAVVAGGGTGQTTLANHSVLLGQGTSAISSTGPCSAGETIIWAGGASADPTCGTIAGAGTVTSVAVSSSSMFITSTPITTSGTFNLQLAQTRPGGRLTLTSATPVLAADVSSGQTVYYTPYQTNLVPIYDGTQFRSYPVSEVSVAMAGNAAWASGSMYDWFIVLDSGTIRLCSGPAWSSVTSRGTGAGTTQLTLLSGIWVNAQALTCRYATGSTTSVAGTQATYVGSMYATSNGTTKMEFKLASASTGSAPTLGLYNAYNRTMARTNLLDSDNSIACASSTWAVLGAGWVITWVDGLQQSAPQGNIMVTVNPSAGNSGQVGMGLDWSSGAPVLSTYAVQGAGLAVIYTNTALETFLPQLGKHTITGIMSCSGATTYYGDGAGGMPTSNMTLAVEM